MNIKGKRNLSIAERAQELKPPFGSITAARADFCPSFNPSPTHYTIYQESTSPTQSGLVYLTKKQGVISKHYQHMALDQSKRSDLVIKSQLLTPAPGAYQKPLHSKWLLSDCKD